MYIASQQTNLRKHVWISRPRSLWTIFNVQCMRSPLYPTKWWPAAQPGVPLQSSCHMLSNIMKQSGHSKPSHATCHSSGASILSTSLLFTSHGLQSLHVDVQPFLILDSLYNIPSLLQSYGLLPRSRSTNHADYLLIARQAGPVTMREYQRAILHFYSKDVGSLNCLQVNHN